MVSSERIAVRAYFRWLADHNREANRALEDWLSAEVEESTLTEQTMPPPPQVPTYNMTTSSQGRTAPYQCLIEDPRPPNIEKTRELVKILLNQYTNTTLPIKKWRRLPAFVVNWLENGKAPRQSVQLRFDWLVDHLIKNRKLQHQQLGLGPPEKVRANWMDSDVTFWGHYAPTSNDGTPNTLTIVLPTRFGPEFPVSLVLEREGFATTSPQLHLQRGLLLARARILQEAPLLVPQKYDPSKGEHAQMRMGGNPPLAALMEFFNLWVTVVDITLTQAYYAGFYLPSEETGLNFRPTLMGPVTGRRVSDKLKWVHALSGKHLDANAELKTFIELKGVRNHLAHFDPPCFSVTIDDIAGWLSKVPDLAWLLIKIRSCLNLPISGHIIQMAMAPPVIAVPRDPNHERHPQREDVGYASSTWRNGNPHRGRDPLQISESLIGQLERLKARIESLDSREVSLADVLRLLMARGFASVGAEADQELLAQFKALPAD
jgi:hypothetical protein